MNEALTNFRRIFREKARDDEISQRRNSADSYIGCNEQRKRAANGARMNK